MLLIIMGIIFLVSVVISLLYWFEYRPYIARKDCARKTLEIVTNSKENESNTDVDFIYNMCMRVKGIKK